MSLVMRAVYFGLEPKGEHALSWLYPRGSGRRPRRTMQRELTYHVPFERLVKLSRSAGYKMNPHMRWLVWLLIALAVSGFAFLYTFGDEIRDVAEDEGIPFATELAFIGVFVVFVVGLRLLRRYQMRLMQARVNF